MRRLVLLLALVIGWFSLTTGERKKLAKAGRDAMHPDARTS
jgi:hypothetical protein